MRILITGAGGFIGSHLMDEFGGESAWGMDNFLTGRRENHRGVLDGDVTERSVFYTYANELEPEVVIHCSASYSDPDLWHRDTDINVNGAINAAIVAKHHGAHLVYFQTILPPVSSYAISKIAAEQYLRLSGVPLTVLRLANIYGPRNLSGPIPVFYKRISEGKPCTIVDTTRDMVFIADLVRCVKMVVENGITGTFDVCSGVQTPIMELFQQIQNHFEEWEVPPLIPPAGDDVQGTISLDNALASWKWLERTPLRYGIEQTIHSYRETGVDHTHTHLRIGEKDAS